MVCDIPQDEEKKFTVDEIMRKPKSLKKCKEQVACAGSEILYQEIEKLHTDIEIIRTEAHRLLSEKSENVIRHRKEIEKAFRALSLAIDELMTQPQYEKWHPYQLRDKFLKEAGES